MTVFVGKRSDRSKFQGVLGILYNQKGKRKSLSREQEAELFDDAMHYLLQYNEVVRELKTLYERGKFTSMPAITDNDAHLKMSDIAENAQHHRTKKEPGMLTTVYDHDSLSHHPDNTRKI